MFHNFPKIFKPNQINPIFYKAEYIFQAIEFVYLNKETLKGYSSFVAFKVILIIFVTFIKIQSKVSNIPLLSETKHLLEIVCLFIAPQTSCPLLSLL